MTKVPDVDFLGIQSLEPKYKEKLTDASTKTSEFPKSFRVKRNIISVSVQEKTQVKDAFSDTFDFDGEDNPLLNPRITISKRENKSEKFNHAQLDKIEKEEESYLMPNIFE